VASAYGSYGLERSSWAGIHGHDARTPSVVAPGREAELVYLKVKAEEWLSKILTDLKSGLSAKRPSRQSSGAHSKSRQALE